MPTARTLLALLSFAALTLVALQAQAQSDKLRVGVCGSPPFVVTDGEDVEGLSIDVWRAVAEREELRYDLIPVDEVDEALSRVASGGLDVAVGPISITAARARRVAFTQPYFQSRLAIAAPVESRSWLELLSPFFTKTFFGGLATVLIVLGIVGTLLWLAERRKNPDQFPKQAWRGIGNGVWLALVTMTTVGYGDRAPKTVPGKVITGVWMVVALLTATSLMAGIASTITVAQLDAARISTAGGLRGHRVATVQRTPAAKLVRSHGARLVPADSLEHAVAAVAAGRADAVVFDEPQLRHHLAQHPEIELLVSDATYHPQGYGFALQPGDERVHDLNVSLLTEAERGTVDRARNTWLPDANP